jgi:hypothetical protein
MDETTIWFVLVPAVDGVSNGRGTHGGCTTAERRPG